MKITKNILWTISLNCMFCLVVVFKHSIISLAFLFTMFLISSGIIMHLVYMLVNDKKSKSQADVLYEEVSEENVILIMKSLINNYLSIVDEWYHLISFIDPAKTLSAFFVMHLLVIFVWVFNVRMWTLLWTISLFS